MPRVSGSRTRSRIWTVNPRFTTGAGIGLPTIGAPPCQSRAPADQTAMSKTVTNRSSDDGMSSLARDILASTSTRVSRSRGTTIRPALGAVEGRPSSVEGAVRPGPGGRRRLVQLTHFAFAFPHHVQEGLDVLDGLFLRLRLEQGEAADDLLGFREWAILDRELPVCNPDACAKCCWQAALCAEEVAFAHAHLDEFPHRRDVLGARGPVRFFRGVNRQKSHVPSPFRLSRRMSTHSYVERRPLKSTGRFSGVGLKSRPRHAGRPRRAISRRASPAASDAGPRFSWTDRRR